MALMKSMCKSQVLASMFLSASNTFLCRYTIMYENWIEHEA